jgi:hypothetical protein
MIFSSDIKSNLRKFPFGNLGKLFMKNKMLVFFSCVMLFSLRSRGQDLRFKPDSTFKSHREDQLRLIDQGKIRDFDFQLRLYFGSGFTIVSKQYLLLITLKGGAWSAEQYVFTDSTRFRITNKKVRIDSSEVKVADYPALFTELISDSLMSITSLDDLQIIHLVKERKLDQEKGIIVVADGNGYIVELLSPAGHRGFGFHCPKSYADYYQLPELQRVVAILQILMKLIQAGVPC